MKTKTRSVLLALLSLTTLAANFTVKVDTWARGGGGFAGGGGFRGGGYRGEAGNYRGDFDRGFASDGAYRGRSDFGGVGNFSRADIATAAPRVSNEQLRAGADRNYNWGSQRALSTDGGFGNMASAGSLGHQTNRIAPAALESQGRSVRSDYGDNYGRNDLFNRSWWAAHPGYWDRAMANDWAWGYGNWPALAGWWGVPIATEPTYYDYGDNISYANDDVYYGSQPVESAQAYYSQAQTLAQSLPASFPTTGQQQKKEWKPLGVYSLVQGQQTNSTTMFQLAVNKKGAIKGTYYNALTSETQPVQGAVDKKNMRAAWTVGTNKDVVYDTGVSNLLKAQSPLLLHLGKDKTEQWTLVRLQQSKNKATT